MGSLKGSYDVAVGKCRRHGDLRSGCVESVSSFYSKLYIPTVFYANLVGSLIVQIQFSSIPALIAPDGVAGGIGHTARTEHVAPVRANQVSCSRIVEPKQ